MCACECMCVFTSVVNDIRPDDLSMSKNVLKFFLTDISMYATFFYIRYIDKMLITTKFFFFYNLCTKIN